MIRMFFEKLIQLMIIHRVQKNFDEASKKAQLERPKETHHEESLLEVFTRRLNEYGSNKDSDDYQGDDDNNDDD